MAMCEPCWNDPDPDGTDEEWDAMIADDEQFMVEQAALNRRKRGGRPCLT